MQFVDLPLLETKFDIPTLCADTLVRKRLLALAPKPADARLLLACAPAGYGKTSFLAAWSHALEKQGVAVAWLSLDADDDYPARFLAYFHAALARAIALPDPCAEEPPAIVATRLLNELAAYKRDVVVVLDDYQTLQSPEVHEIVAYLLEHLPAHVCLAIGSRVEPPLPLARLRVREELAELCAEDLRLTLPETEALVRAALGVPPDSELIRTISTQTEGWPAAIQLLAHELQHQMFAHPRACVDAGQRHIFAYLAQEVFDHQPPHLKAFMLQTGILEQMCAPLCDAVAGYKTGTRLENEAVTKPASGSSDTSSRLLLETLECDNLFLVPLDRWNGWYRYHHEFKAFLRARLAMEPQGTIVELHRRASVWFEQQRLWAEASRHALAAGDRTHAAALLEQADAQTSSERLLTLEWGALENELEPVVEAVTHTTDTALHALHGTDRAHRECETHRAAWQHNRLLSASLFDGSPILVEPLTERELDVLRLIAGGASNQHIASALVISLGTVKSHINHILGKLAAHNRTEAVARARQLGMLVPY